MTKQEIQALITTAIAGKADKLSMFSTQTGNYTATLGDAGTIVYMNVGTANTFTIPNNSTVAYPIGTTMVVRQEGIGLTTIVPASGVTIPGVLALSGQYGSCGLLKTATNTWSILGTGTAVADATAPTISSKNTTSATSIAIVFPEAVTTSGVTGWSFKKNGSTLAASAVSGSGTNTLTFTVATMAYGDTILVSYSSSTGDTIDAAGNELASVTDSAVTNNVGDTVAPTVTTATATTLHTIVIVFSETVIATNVGWSFKQNGSSITPTGVSGTGTNTLTFTVSQTLLSSDTILRSYNSSTGDTVDQSSNELVAFTDSAVTNSIGSRRNFSRVRYERQQVEHSPKQEQPEHGELQVMVFQI